MMTQEIHNRVALNRGNVTFANPSPELMQSRLKRGIYIIEADGLHKRCSRCRDYWPADSEFFYSGKAEKDGLIDWCKACYQEWRYPNGRPSQKNQFTVDSGITA